MAKNEMRIKGTSNISIIVARNELRPGDEVEAPFSRATSSSKSTASKVAFKTCLT